MSPGDLENAPDPFVEGPASGGRGSPGAGFAHVYLGVPRGLRGNVSPESWCRALRREGEIRALSGERLARRPMSVLIGGEAPSALGTLLPQCVEGVLETLVPGAVPGPTRLREVAGEDGDPPGGRAGLVGPGEWTVEIEEHPRPRTSASWTRLVAHWVAGGVTRVCVRADPTAGVGGWDSERFALVEAVGKGAPPTVAADLVLPSGAATREVLVSTIDALVDRGVSHVSVYEPTGEVGDPEEAEKAFEDHWLGALERLHELGFRSTSLLEHARSGHESRYARALRRRWAVLGLGPRAVTFRNPLRRWNVPEWGDYRALVARGSDPVAGGEVLPPDAVRLERIWSRLQDVEGLRLPGGSSTLEAEIDGWVRHGWARWSGRRVGLTRSGWMRVDGLAVALASLAPGPRRDGDPPRVSRNDDGTTSRHPEGR